MAEVTDEIRARVDIVELVGQRVALKRAGKDWKGLCPFHDDKNPSFQVSPTLGRYRCWSCGESGDAFTWVMKTQNVDFPEALQILAARTGVVLPKDSRRAEPSKRADQAAAMSEALSFFQSQLARQADAKEYCERRALDAEVQRTWELGFAPDEGTALATHLRKKGFQLAECRTLFLVDQDSTGGYFDRFRGRLMFPIRDERGDLVAFGGRILGDGHPKYVNSGDTPLFHKSRVLYGLYRAKDAIAKDRKAVLVEGYLDVIACHRAGVNTAVASLGTSLTEDHAKILKRWCDGVIVLYDSDPAGQKAAERAIEVLEPVGLKVRIVLLPSGEDPDTMLRRDGPAALKRAVDTLLTPTEYRLELLKKRIPVQNEDFWTEAIGLLAAAPSIREMEVLIMALAPLHPRLRDQISAQASLRADAMAARKAKDRRASGARENAGVQRSTLQLSAAERVLFHAFLSGDFRVKAFQILHEADLWETKQGEEFARAVCSTFDAPPDGLPNEWLHRLDESIQQSLVDLELETKWEPLSRAVLEETAERLRQKRANRQLSQIKNEEESRRAFLDGHRKRARADNA